MDLLNAELAAAYMAKLRPKSAPSSHAIVAAELCLSITVARSGATGTERRTGCMEDGIGKLMAGNPQLAMERARQCEEKMLLQKVTAER
jgi:hypothetical protein